MDLSGALDDGQGAVDGWQVFGAGADGGQFPERIALNTFCPLPSGSAWVSRMASPDCTTLPP